MNWIEVRRRLAEAVSLVSCALNILVGTGDREVTLSAGSWELRRRNIPRGRWLVGGIDRLPWNGVGHCEQAWRDHEPIWAKVRAEGGARG